MTIRITTHKAKDAQIAAYAETLKTGLLAAHEASPFENAGAVSEWLHRQNPNPRLRVATQNNDRTIKVTWRTNVQKETNLLTIDCR